MYTIVWRTYFGFRTTLLFFITVVRDYRADNGAPSVDGLDTGTIEVTNTNCSCDRSSILHKGALTISGVNYINWKGRLKVELMK